MVGMHSSVEENLLGVRISQDQAHDLLQSDEIRRFLSGDTGDQSSHEMTEISSDNHSSQSTISLLENEPRVVQPDSTQNQVIEVTGTEEPGIRQKAVFRTWLPETLALLCGLGAFIAIIMILAGFSKTEQPQWPSYMNLSTVVALLATILRSMLMQVIEAGKFTYATSSDSE